MAGRPSGAGSSLRNLQEDLAWLRDKALCLRACRALRVSIIVIVEVSDFHQADSPLWLCLKIETLEEGDLHIPVALEVGYLHQADRPLGLCLKGLIEGALATMLTSAARVLVHAWLSSSLFSLDPQPHPLMVSRGPTHKPPVDLPCPSVAEIELTQDLLAQH